MGFLWFQPWKVQLSLLEEKSFCFNHLFVVEQYRFSVKSWEGVNFLLYLPGCYRISNKLQAICLQELRYSHTSYTYRGLKHLLLFRTGILLFDAQDCFTGWLLGIERGACQTSACLRRTRVTRWNSSRGQPLKCQYTLYLWLKTRPQNSLFS